jgi:heme oxygenase
MNRTLSELLREGTKDSHFAAEHTPFIQKFFKGELRIEDYSRFLLQLYFIYQTMEEKLREHKRHPFLKFIYYPELFRTKPLERDLNHYFKSDFWNKIKPLETTINYSSRITQLSDEWPEGLVAHSYARYLGDLSGGQVLKRLVEKMYTLSNGSGTSFYKFPLIPDQTKFKQDYRMKLDYLPVNAESVNKIVDEANYAFQLNMNLFNSLM